MKTTGVSSIPKFGLFLGGGTLMTMMIMMMTMKGKMQRERETKKREKEEKIETQKKNVK